MKTLGQPFACFTLRALTGCACFPADLFKKGIHVIIEPATLILTNHGNEIRSIENDAPVRHHRLELVLHGGNFTFIGVERLKKTVANDNPTEGKKRSSDKRRGRPHNIIEIHRKTGNGEYASIIHKQRVPVLITHKREGIA